MTPAATSCINGNGDACTEDGCNAVCIPSKDHRCLAHADDDTRQDYLSTLASGGDVDLRGVTFEELLWTQIVDAFSSEGGTAEFGGLRLENAVFRCDVELSGAQFYEQAVFDGAKFHGEAIFDKATFHSHCRFIGCQFFESFSLHMSTVVGDCLLSRAIIQGGANLEQVKVGSAIWLEETIVKGSANFRKLVVENVGFFNKVKIGGAANFTSATFVGDASFEAATFGGVARFTEVQFTGLAWFVDVWAKSEVWFDKATFRRDCRFTGVTFLGDALYQNSQFLGTAWFDNVEVFKSINFDEALFSKDIMLAASHFKRNVSLTAAQVKTAEEIGPIIVGGMFILDQASFYNSISIRIAAPRVSCTATKFLEGATIDVTRTDVLLNRALFGKSSSVVGNTLDRALGTAPSRLLSMYGVDANNLALINLNLAPCRFSGARNLDKMRIEAARPFADSPPACRIRVGNRTIPLWRRWTRRQTLAEEHEWRYSNSSARTSRWARLKRVIACPEWNPRECHFPEWAAQRAGRSPLPLVPEDLARLYRSLRKAQEDNKNEPGAADFYYGEMEMRRRSSDTPLSERFILHLYWLSSGYALRASRTVALLLGILILNGFLCYFIGLSGTRGSSIISSTVYVVETALSLPTEQLELSIPIRILRIVLRLTVPLLVGLTILCVRNRIKR